MHTVFSSIGTIVILMWIYTAHRQHVKWSMSIRTRLNEGKVEAVSVQGDDEAKEKA